MTPSREPFDPYYHWLGIPPDEQPPNHYRLLGIQPLEENQEVIQNAADRQMAHLRTFQSGPRATDSQRILNEVSAARVCLLSPERKTSYDEQLRASATRQSVTPPTAPPNVTATTVSPTSETALPRDGQVEPPLVRTTVSAQSPMAKRAFGRRRSHLPLLVAVGFSGLVVTAVVVTVAMYGGWGRPAAGHRLVLNWPLAQRRDATLEIDGQQVDLSAAVATTDDAVELLLEPGKHTYRIARPRYHLLEGQFTLQLNQRLEIDVVFTPNSVRDAPRTRELLLIWRESDRTGHVLQIDGRPCDLTDENVQVNGDQIRVQVPPGLHQVALIKDDGERLEWSVDSRSGRPIVLSHTGTIVLRWSAANRHGLTLLVDDQPIDLADPKIRDNGLEIEWEVPAGRRTLKIRDGDSLLLSRRLLVTAGKRLPVDADALAARFAPRLVLLWPAKERAGATLEVDGVPRPVPTDAAADATRVTIDMDPGGHTIRVKRPGYDLFERTVTLGRGTFTIPVTAQRITAAAMDAEQRERLRDAYVKTYTQYDEFRSWSEETDPAKKQRAIAALITRMVREANSLPRSSPEQYVAFDQTYRMAADQNQLLAADGIARFMRANRCIGDEEQQKRQRELRDRAVSNADFDNALSLLRSPHYAGTKLTPDEEQTLCNRIGASPEIQQDYRQVERKVDSFFDAGLLSPGAACQLHATVLLRAGNGAQLEPGPALDLAEKMLTVVPDLLPLETEDALATSDALIDAANGMRRKVMADRRSPASLRTRVDQLNVSAKEMQEEVAAYRRVMEARVALAADTGTAAQHKLLGLWLLQHSKYDEALPHLRQSEDATLSAIARPLPAKASELAELADEVETESKKTRYLKRHEWALRDYANHIRQLALSRQGDTLDEDAREQVKMQADNTTGQLFWEGLPQGKWRPLLGIVSLDTLRQHAEKPVEGNWNVLDDGTIESTQRSVSRLETPVKPSNSYAIRCVCRLDDGEYININLPLGDRAVLFTMGAYNGRVSGLQMINGKNVDDPENGTSIPRAKFGLRRGVPVQVEIHVDLLPLDSQSSKQRKMSGRNDWVRIAVMLNGTAFGGVSAAKSRFSMPPRFAVSPDAIGFSAEAAASYANIELYRK